MSDKYKEQVYKNWIQITNELLDLDYSLKSNLVSYIATTKKRTDDRQDNHSDIA